MRPGGATNLALDAQLPGSSVCLNATTLRKTHEVFIVGKNSGKAPEEYFKDFPFGDKKLGLMRYALTKFTDDFWIPLRVDNDSLHIDDDGWVTATMGYPDHIRWLDHGNQVKAMKSTPVDALELLVQELNFSFWNLSIVGGDVKIAFSERVKQDYRFAPVPKKYKRSFLNFDGKKMCWSGEAHHGKCWAAVSGARGFQEPRHQSKISKGPLPEGIWIVKQEEYQNVDDTPLANRIGGYLSPIIEPFHKKVGAWPGGSISWGNHRIWLVKKSVPKMYGRDPATFSIHGGWIKGSAGCIDMTDNMEEFAKAFIEYGKDMELIVSYV